MQYKKNLITYFMLPNKIQTEI